MLHRRATTALLLTTLILLSGCATRHVDLFERTLGNAALFEQVRAYDGHTGRPLSLAQVAQRCRAADVVFFGEEHGDVVCNQTQAQLLHALLGQPRPIALAMEFFETDTQSTLDAYLAGRIDHDALVEGARQGRPYVLSHRPLIELCKATDAPVIAANAPRRLVRQYRRSEMAYPEFLETLEPRDRRWLPRESEPLEGGYRDRFFELMGGHNSDPSVEDDAPPADADATQPTSAPSEPLVTRPPTEPTAATAPSEAIGPEAAAVADSGDSTDSQPTTTSAPTTTATTSAPTTATAPAEPEPGSRTEDFFRAQLLWDDAMAESIALYRAQHRDDRVLLIVGGFHVASDGGAVVKYRLRRPTDRMTTIVYASSTDADLPMEPRLRDVGDIVLVGIKPPAAPAD